MVASAQHPTSKRQFLLSANEFAMRLPIKEKCRHTLSSTSTPSTPKNTRNIRRYLARGGQMKVLEGSWEPTRIVILEFPSYEQAHEWWHSAEYAPAKELRQRLSTTDLLIVDGYTPAS
jgi:uncharacterized protein (DUF1330 family)